MAFLKDRKFFVGGKPVLVLSGEVHYFRLDRGEWHDRIRKAKQSGCNAIASYIPWMFHEETEGQIDLTGSRRLEHDLGAFIDLCKAEDLWFIARLHKTAPVSREMILNFIAQHSLGLPKSY